MGILWVCYGYPMVRVASRKGSALIRYRKIYGICMFLDTEKKFCADLFAYVRKKQYLCSRK